MIDFAALTQALEPCCPNCSYNKHGDRNLSVIVAAARLVLEGESDQ